MKLLVTRPEPDALRLAGRLEELGHEAIIEPLLAADFSDADEVDLSEVQALIATSRNGLRALKFQRAHRIAAELPLFAVGGATAKEARALGFKLIVTGAGTGEQLVPQIASALDPQAGFLLHLAGDKLAFDLSGELQSHGFRVLQPQVYRMLPATRLSAVAEAAMTDQSLDGVLLMSPRTADVFVRLVTAAGLSAHARSLTYYCLSPAVARRITPLGSGIRVETASTPSLEDLLSMLV
jgi:uroporphyrinogen-III synthase